MEAPLLNSDDQQFQRQIEEMESQELLNIIQILQEEMGFEQKQFNELSVQLADLPQDAPAYDDLHIQLQESQQRLTTLMERSKSCFNQQLANKNRYVLAEESHSSDDEVEDAAEFEERHSNNFIRLSESPTQSLVTETSRSDTVLHLKPVPATNGHVFPVREVKGKGVHSIKSDPGTSESMDFDPFSNDAHHTVPEENHQSSVLIDFSSSSDKPSSAAPHTSPEPELASSAEISLLLSKDTVSPPAIFASVPEPENQPETQPEPETEPENEHGPPKLPDTPPPTVVSHGNADLFSFEDDCAVMDKPQETETPPAQSSQPESVSKPVKVSRPKEPAPPVPVSNTYTTSASLQSTSTSSVKALSANFQNTGSSRAGILKNSSASGEERTKPAPKDPAPTVQSYQSSVKPKTEVATVTPSYMRENKVPASSASVTAPSTKASQPIEETSRSQTKSTITSVVVNPPTSTGPSTATVTTETRETVRETVKTKKRVVPLRDPEPVKQPQQTRTVQEPQSSMTVKEPQHSGTAPPAGAPQGSSPGQPQPRRVMPYSVSATRKMFESNGQAPAPAPAPAPVPSGTKSSRVPLRVANQQQEPQKQQQQQQQQQKPPWSKQPSTIKTTQTITVVASAKTVSSPSGIENKEQRKPQAVSSQPKTAHVAPVKQQSFSTKTTPEPAPVQEVRVKPTVPTAKPTVTFSEPPVKTKPQEPPANRKPVAATKLLISAPRISQETSNIHETSESQEAENIPLIDPGVAGRVYTAPQTNESEGFTSEDKIQQRVTLKHWDPSKLLEELYYIKYVPERDARHVYVNMEGYMEKMPINKRKATLLKTWKRRYFRAKDGVIYYYENSSTDQAQGYLQLVGGEIEEIGEHMIGVDDGRGRYMIVKAPSEQEYQDWKRALESQIVPDTRAQYVKVARSAPPHPDKKVILIDLGSCSTRAGILCDQACLPQVFFPSVMATDKRANRRYFGMEAYKPSVRENSTLSFPIRSSAKLDKHFADMDMLPDLFTYIFKQLNVSPAGQYVMISAPANLGDKVKSQVIDMLVRRFSVAGVNIQPQSQLVLYAYSATSGIVVDIGERLEIVPVTDGYISEQGITRQPYGGNKIAETLNSCLTERRYRFFTDVDYPIVRLASEKLCFVSDDFIEDVKRCQQHPDEFRQTLDLSGYDLPDGSWTHVSHDIGRFRSPEGIFNTELWGMDNPSLPKLIQKAIQACPMDTRREMWRSIYVSGGVTMIPGFVERLQAELTKRVPPSIIVEVHAAPHRYHAAFIGAATLASMNVFEQSCITAAEWKKTGQPLLRKWHMY